MIFQLLRIDFTNQHSGENVMCPLPSIQYRISMKEGIVLFSEGVIT